MSPQLRPKGTMPTKQQGPAQSRCRAMFITKVLSYSGETLDTVLFTSITAQHETGKPGR